MGGVHQSQLGPFWPLMPLIMLSTRCRWMCFFAMSVASMVAQAQTNRCPRADGSVEFSDRPCAPSSSAGRPRTNASAPTAVANQSPLSPAARKAMIDKWEADLKTEIQRRAAATTPPTAMPAPAAAAVNSGSESMTFADCTTRVTGMLLSVAGRGRTHLIVRTDQLTIVRVCTTDGSLLVTCSARDQRMVTTTSTNRQSC